ncbi:MAG TPA: LptF/LptG family permease [Myxococcales bacterium]|nr:LptF/LptG family permease [Myxococcales bacterium]
MTPTLFRYVLRNYAAAFAGIFAAMVAVYLVVDFVDTGSAYQGPTWAVDVAWLYANKALTVARQLAPAALLLAAAVAVSAMHKRGELTAVGALAFGPSAVYLPVAALALGISLGMVAFDEEVVLPAGRRMDDILAHRFNRWSGWFDYHPERQWLRRGEWIFLLRSGDADQGFSDATLLRVNDRFELLQRLDARRLEWVDGDRWRLVEVVERRFEPGGASPSAARDAMELDLGVERDDLRIRAGRPELMRFPELFEQIRVRRRAGLPTHLLSLALHNRVAYPVAGFPAALLAAGLALRPGRRGHLTRAVVEGMVIVLLLWGLTVVGRTLVVTGRMAAGLAAWAPAVILALAAAALWLDAEGKLPRRPAP